VPTLQPPAATAAFVFAARGPSVLEAPPFYRRRQNGRAGAAGGGRLTDARFPDRWIADKRLQLLSDSHFRSFVMSLIWAVSNLTDGIIEESDLSLIPRFDTTSTGAFVASGLWADRETGGWVITVFESTQTTAADLKAAENARIKQRDKKRRQRENARMSPGTSGGQGGGQGLVAESYPQGLTSYPQGARNPATSANGGVPGDVPGDRVGDVPGDVPEDTTGQDRTGLSLEEKRSSQPPQRTCPHHRWPAKGCSDCKAADDARNRWDAEQLRAVAEAKALANKRCLRCDEEGWLKGPDDTPVDPGVKCNHTNQMDPISAGTGPRSIP
jgi:hypothetical protein